MFKKEHAAEQLEAVRNQYKDLGLVSSRAAELAEAFESRYKSAAFNRMDLRLFLEEERAFAESLLKREQKAFEKKQERENRAGQPTATEQRLEKYRKSIEKYMHILIDGNNDELKRLFGAIDELDRKHWSAISRFLREQFPVRAKSPLESMENQLQSMVSSQEGKPPQVLGYYGDCVRRNEADKADNAAFAAIKEAAFFLNDLLQLLKEVNFSEEEAAFIFLQNVIEDFRLRDIKRRPKLLK